MNTRLKKRRVKRWKAPKPVPPPQPPRPKRTQLRNIYKNLIASSRDERLESLKKAMHWYEGLQAYLAYEAVFTFHQKKAKAAAEKYRLKGLNSDKSEIKEQSYIAAINEYEKMGRKYHPPKLGAYLSKYSRKRSKLVTRKRRFDKKYSEILSIMDKALRPVNVEHTRITLNVDKLTSNYRIDSEGNVTFDRKFLDMTRKTVRTNGLFPGVLDVLPILTEAAATTMEKDGQGHRTGRYVVSGTKRHQALLLMLEHLRDYCMYHDRSRIIRRHKEVVHAKA
jgi:hypothetical protein